MLLSRLPRRNEGVPPGLVQMRRVAGGLLVAMAALFLLTHWLAARHPEHALAIGFVQSFAEAAMVGGLADWFAVTALFRHPLGLPIPHTAIVPRNKDRIGDTLAAFLRDNFLIPGVVARRMRPIDLAGTLGRWLSRPRDEGALSGDGRLRRGAAGLATNLLDMFDQQQLGSMVKSGIGARLRTLEVSPLLGQALGAAIADGRHLPLLDGLIRWAAQVINANEHLVRAMVHERAGSLLRWTGLDETIADKIIDGLNGLVNDMAADPAHPLRAKAEEGLEVLAYDLQHDPKMRARVEAMKAEMIENPAMQRWLEGLWEQARGSLRRLASNPDAAMRGRLGDLLRDAGRTLQEDPRLRATVNRFARRAAVGIAADYGDAIVRLVSETVRGWDAQTITRRLENAVGQDLQYIRINGTLVGGMVGLAIHAVAVQL